MDKNIKITGNEKKVCVCVRAHTGCFIMCVGRVSQQLLHVFHLFKNPFH